MLYKHNRDKLLELLFSHAWVGKGEAHIVLAYIVPSVRPHTLFTSWLASRIGESHMGSFRVVAVLHGIHAIRGVNTPIACPLL